MGCLNRLKSWVKDILRSSQHFSNFSEEDILTYAFYFTKDETPDWSFSVYITRNRDAGVSFYSQRVKKGVFKSQIGIQPLDLKEFKRNGLTIRRITENNKDRFFLINNGNSRNAIFVSIPIFNIDGATYTAGKNPYFYLESGKSVELKIKED